MTRFKNYNYSQGFLSLISILIILAIIILILMVYFGFNKIIRNNQPQPSPLEAIEKAKEAKDLLESRQMFLKE